MNKLQSGLLFSLTGITAAASLPSCTSQKKGRGAKALQHCVHNDRRPYGPDDELL